MLANLAFICLTTLRMLNHGSDQPPKIVGNLEIAKQILARETEWVKVAASHDLEECIRFYAKDALLLAPNEPMSKDPKSIRQSWVPLTEENTHIDWTIIKIEVANSGDLAYTVGTYRLNIKDSNGNLVSDHGKLVEVWRKEKSGNWKVVVDTFNSDIPTP